jgi:tripeptidyl-peptidase-1
LRPDLNPAPSFTEGFIDGGVNPQNTSLASLVANLNIQYTVGVASGVATVFVSVGRSDVQVFFDLASTALKEQVPPTVLLIAYEFDEASLSPSAARYVPFLSYISRIYSIFQRHL